MTTSSGPSQPAPPAKPSAAASPLPAARTNVAALRGQVTQLRGQAESAESVEARSNATAQWAAARDQIRTALLGVQPDDLFTGLEANVPLVLLPVRLETSFAVDGSSLLHVRIFPDDLHIDGHDEELTSTEAALGAAMWAAPADVLAFGETAPAPPPGPDLPDGRRARWVSLVNMLGGPRAAWVAHATRPAQSAGGAAPAALATKPQAYVRPAVARALPDRWLVRVYAGGAVAGQAWTSPVGVDLHMAPDPQATSSASASTTGTSTGTGTASPGTASPGTGAGTTASAGSSAPSTASSGLPSIDPEMLWMIDYPTAVSVGMAVDVPLPTGTQSIDRVVAVGVRASTSPADAVTELAGLLTAHRYTDGLGFLPPGSQTSNTPDARSAYGRQADPDQLWQQEFGPPAGAGTAAAILAAALGLPAGVVDGSASSGDTGDAQAAAMQTALWSATWGYYLGQLIDPAALRGVTVDGVRDHYRQFVRSRGTIPTLRLGRQPYGVLPLLPLGRWVSDGASATVDGLARLLTRVRPLWQYGVGQPVTASEGPGFDQAFTTVMSTDAVGRSYQIRSALADRTFDPLIFTGVDTKPGNGVIDAMIGNLLTLGSNPLILDVFSATAQPVRAPLVVDPTDPTPDATVRAAILGLAAANPTIALADAAFMKPRPQGPATVLHTLLRRSLLLEYAAAGISLAKISATAQGTPVISTGLPSSIPSPPTAATRALAQPAGPAEPAGPAGHTEPTDAAGSPVPPSSPVQPGGIAQPEGTVHAGGVQPAGGTGPAGAAAAPVRTSMLFGLSPAAGGGFTPVQSMPAALSTPVTAVTGQLTAGEWLWRNPASQPDLRRDLDQTLAAFDLLAGVSAAGLDLLLRETLDLATHRWTAWAESVAADKVARLRAATPAGVTLGGWGVVERLTRSPRVPADPSLSAGASGGPLWADERPGGFVHAPSTAQAGTAAVLRAAHLAHGGENDPSCAVDLSSAPARAAQRLSDGIRSGQELGALLGYEMERYLHDNSADVLIAPLRAYAPRWQASGTFVEGNPQAIVSPSAVVDGLALADADPSAVAQAVLPTGAAASAALAAALSSGLAMLRSQQDALADLLTAEGIHHVLTGNSDRAGAALNAAHRGGLPPDDYDVLRTPRSGASLTCRVGVLLPASGSALAGGWPGSPRGAADSSCAAWLATVLPAVTAVRVRVANSAGAVSAIALPAAAGLGPLDIVLDRPEVVRTRIELALPAGNTVLTGRDPAWTPSTVGLDELLTVAADLREVLSARPMRSTDLLMAGAAAGAADERDAADLLARLTAARSSLQQAAQAVAAAAGPLGTAVAVLAAGGQSPPDLATTLGAARTALGAALAHGVMLQLDPAAAPADALAVLGAATAELTRRLALPGPATGASADELAGALRGLLGANQPGVPRLLIDTGTAAVAVAGLAAGDVFVAAAPDLAADWLDDVAGVRASTGHLVAAIQGCDALTVGAGLTDGWRIIDPSGHQAAWTATLDATALAALGPAATIVLRAAAGAKLAAGGYVAGLMVDEWVEVVPQETAATSVAYQADAPVARAPQAILLGVAPDVTAGWNADIVLDLALEALSLAGLRTVDVETGAWLGRMLPAILLPDGDASEVIAAPPLPLLQVDAGVLESGRANLKGLG
jgi:hypothetical protein